MKFFPNTCTANITPRVAREKFRDDGETRTSTLPCVALWTLSSPVVLQDSALCWKSADEM